MCRSRISAARRQHCFVDIDPLAAGDGCTELRFGMDRRLTGALLVVAVAVTAAVLPALSGRRISGHAQTIALPADPRVGDCVLESSPGSPDVVGELTALPESTDGSRSAARSAIPVEVGACTGRPVLGEVVAVVTTAHHDLKAHPVPPPGVDCRSPALEYAGLVPADKRYELRDQPDADPVKWNFSINTGNRWVLPSQRLVSAGRTWSACVASPNAGEEYAGRLADAYSGRSLPASFGTCWNSPQVGAAARMLDCSRHHSAELISAGRIDDISAVTIEQVASSCGQLAALVMRRSDPTGGGALVIKTSPDRLTFKSMVRPVNVLCYLSSARRELDDTVVGLGERPIPFAD